MKIWLIFSSITLVILALVATFAVRVYMSEDYFQTVGQEAGIGDISITVEPQGVVIDVTTIRSLSCSQIMSVLELEKMTIDSVVYSPYCIIINRNLARIHYKKVMPV